MEDIEDAIPPVSDGDAYPGNGRLELLWKRYFEFLSLFDAAGRYDDFDRPVSERRHEFVPLGKGGRSHDLHQRDASRRRQRLTPRRADEVLAQIAGIRNVGIVVVVQHGGVA